MRKTARERNNGVLHDEKERNLTVGIFQRSRETLEELLGQKNTASLKGGDIRPEQESVFIFAYLYMRLCVVEDKEKGKKVNP